MAGGGEVDSEEAAVTMEDMTETIATRHLTNSSWKESGRLVVVAHLRLDMARWNMSREVVSLSMSDMVEKPMMTRPWAIPQVEVVVVVVAAAVVVVVIVVVVVVVVVVVL